MALLYRMGTGNGSGGDLKPYIVQFTCDSGYIGQTLTMTYKGTPHAGEVVEDVSGTVVLDSTDGKGKLTLYPMHSGNWECSCYSSVISITMKKTIELLYWGTTNVKFNDKPNGATVTPTDDVQTWLYCANIFDKQYTTVLQVVADKTTLNALVQNENANDYLVRSTTFSTTLCENNANNEAMYYLGLYDGCANKLLANDYWNNAICSADVLLADGQTHLFEKVLNVKVPRMISNTAPSGEVTCGSEWSSAYAGLNVFNASQDDYWACADNVISDNAWVGYRFTKNVCVKKVYVKNGLEALYKTDKFTVYGSKTEEWNGVKLGEFNIDNERTVNLDNNDEYLYYRIYINPLLTSSNYMRCGLSTVQFYGREGA